MHVSCRDVKVKDRQINKYTYLHIYVGRLLKAIEGKQADRKIDSQLLKNMINVAEKFPKILKVFSSNLFKYHFKEGNRYRNKNKRQLDKQIRKYKERKESRTMYRYIARNTPFYT